jgi:hypothetical protein
MDVIFEMGYNGIDGLKEYMHNVKSLTVKVGTGMRKMPISNSRR